MIDRVKRREVARRNSAAGSLDGTPIWVSFDRPSQRRSDQSAELFAKKEPEMDPLLLLGILAFVIGFVGVLVLIKGKRKRDL